MKNSPSESNVQSLNDSDLLRRARELALEERRAGIALLHHLREIERRRLYSGSHGSLHEYLVRGLGYSDGAANRRISAMRLMARVPEVEEKLRTGALTLSTASQVQHFISAEKRLSGSITPTSELQLLVKQIEGKSSRETEALLAARSPRVAAALRERPRSIDGQSVQVNVVIGPELQAKLRRLRDRLAHRNPNPSLVEQIEMLADLALQKLEGKVNAQTSGESVSKVSVSASTPRPGPRARASRFVPTALRREVWRRAERRCEQRLSTGERCTRTHRLQLDHRMPRAWGGGHELANLQLLCSTHNLVKSDRLPGECAPVDELRRRSEMSFDVGASGSG
jgi:5-methylcytosine-specific restriction endonuclease McrA